MLENKVKPLQTKLKSMKELHADLKHKLLALTDKIQVSLGLYIDITVTTRVRCVTVVFSDIQFNRA